MWLSQSAIELVSTSLSRVYSQVDDMVILVELRALCLVEVYTRTSYVRCVIRHNFRLNNVTNHCVVSVQTIIPAYALLV
jgi:hypothetical protein